MTLPANGALQLSDIATEFTDNPPHSMSEFYAAGPGLPGSGAISFGDFYGKASQGYTGFSVTPTNINEDGTVAIFTVDAVAIPGGTTLDWTANATGGVEYIPADLEISYDGISYTDLTQNFGTMTVNANGEKYEMWIKAKADLLDDDSNPESFIVTLAATDSAGVLTGSRSATLNINDTSVTPEVPSVELANAIYSIGTIIQSSAAYSSWAIEPDDGKMYKTSDPDGIAGPIGYRNVDTFLGDFVDNNVNAPFVNPTKFRFKCTEISSSLTNGIQNFSSAGTNEVDAWISPDGQWRNLDRKYGIGIISNSTFSFLSIAFVNQYFTLRIEEIGNAANWAETEVRLTATSENT